MGPTLLQSLEEKDKKKIKLGVKYMHYHVHCTFVGMYISDFEIFYLRCFVLFCKKILNSAWQASAKSLNLLPLPPSHPRNL
jgi:hypothetical protein